MGQRATFRTIHSQVHHQCTKKLYNPKREMYICMARQTIDPTNELAAHTQNSHNGKMNLNYFNHMLSHLYI